MFALSDPRYTFHSVSHRTCLSAVFVSVGMLIGTWASRIPALQDGLDISYSMLSMVLLCGGLAGPLVLGTLADFLGMQSAIGFIGLLAIVIAVVASRSRLLR